MIERFQGPRRADLLRGFANAAWWSDLVRTKLARAGLPSLLIALPLLESNYDPLAAPHGSAGAVGLWQFMPATARAYGLEVDDEIDERRDPWRSTDAAVRYLVDLDRESQGNWPIALASFNAGSGRVARATQESGARVMSADDPSAYWLAQSRMPRETQAYLPALVALTRLWGAPAAYGIDTPVVAAPPALARITVAPYTALRDVATAYAVSLTELHRWNPAVRGARTPGRLYPLVIPMVTMATMVTASDVPR
jgi:membrane-bound lytic murein transglycosylase D